MNPLESVDSYESIVNNTLDNDWDAQIHRTRDPDDRTALRLTNKTLSDENLPSGKSAGATMQPATLFRYCPRCSGPRAADNSGQIPFRCSVCGLLYYFSPTVAAAAWLFGPDGRVLLIRRAHDPAAGKFGIPGGFIDIGETAEDGLRREVREEVGLEVNAIRFLTSFPNFYTYREVTYPVLDLIFTATAMKPESAKSLDGVAGLEWRLPVEIDPEELAFPSMRNSVLLL